MYKQYQEVELAQDMMSDKLLGSTVKLHKGQRGVIVEIHRTPGVPVGYDVEIFDKDGDTAAVMILTREKIRPVRGASPKKPVA